MSAEPSISTESTDELTLQEVRHHLDNLIHRGFELTETGLIEALPVSGKSYGVIQWAAQTGKQLTVLAPRHDLLDEYEKTCDEFGLDHQRFPSFYRDCTSFKKNDDGEYEPIDDAAKELKKDYERGFNGVSLHSRHSDTTCQADGECPLVADRDFDPSEYDVLLGTYRHANREKWIEGRYVAFDEFPKDAFLKTFKDGIGPVVSAYLEDMEDKLPFRDYFDFISRKDGSNVQDFIEGWKDSLSSWSYDYKHARQSPNPAAHPLAPTVTLALVKMDRFENNWQYADLGHGRVAVRNPKANEWSFLLPPDLSSAESVIALDGTPNKTLWEIVLDEQMQSLPLLDEEERETYLRDVLGYHFVQTTEKWKAVQSGDGAAPPKDLALIEGISQKEGRQPALISSQDAIRQYESEGLNDLTDTVEHYNNLKGMNDFGKEPLGTVLGNPHPGDGEIEKWAALAGESAEAKEVNGERLTGNDTDYGPFGNEVMYTLIHDEVLQAAMRFGREEEDGVRGATVYLHTSALPNWVPVEKQIAWIQSWLTEKDGMKDTIEAIRSLDGWKHKEWSTTALYDHTSVSNRWVRECLGYLADEGYIKFEGKWGQGTPKHYTNICLEDAGNFGHVEFSG